MDSSYTLFNYFFLMLFFSPLYATEWCINSVVGMEQCVTTCCCLNAAATGYDYYCHGIGIEEQVETSSVYKLGQCCFEKVNHHCCNAPQPLWCMKNHIIQRPPLTPKQNVHKCLYNCCLLKILDTTRSYCCKEMSCSQTVQNFGEYKMAKTVASYCGQHPYYVYGALGVCGCLLCVNGSYAIMNQCTKPVNNLEMNYQTEN